MMKRIHNKKLKFIVPALLAGVLIIGGVTLAYLNKTSKPLTNQFKVGEVTTEIEEDPGVTGSVIKKNPSVVNKGPNDCIIRMRVNISPSSVKEYLESTNGIKYDTKNWAYNEADGFWYYQGVVKINNSTTPLFEEVTNLLTSEGKIIEEFNGMDDFQITLYQEAVQAQVHDEDGTVHASYDKQGNYDATKAMVIWNRYDEK